MSLGFLLPRRTIRPGVPPLFTRLSLTPSVRDIIVLLPRCQPVYPPTCTNQQTCKVPTVPLLWTIQLLTHVTQYRRPTSFDRLTPWKGGLTAGIDPSRPVEYQSRNPRIFRVSTVPSSCTLQSRMLSLSVGVKLERQLLL